MTKSAVKIANVKPYERKVARSAGCGKPIFLLNPKKKAIIENPPPDENPGPYRIGVDDIIRFTQVINAVDPLLCHQLIVFGEGVIKILGAGKVLAEVRQKLN